MKREIHGNIEGVRRTALDQMKLLYDLEIDADVFLPPELSRILAAYTAAMNREIAVYITRDGEIVDIMIGTHQDVELTDYRLRRNSKRLSCVRCIHTHPSATGYLSDVDISALRSFRYDAMTAIAVRDGQPQEVQTAFLGEKIHGENQVLLLDPLRYDRIPQARWMELIEDADQAVLRGEDANAHSETERAVLMGIESEESLKELRRLAETAGAEVVADFVQKREKPDGALFIGRGRAEELARQCQALEADICIFDEELSGFQVRNLEELLRVKVVDRTMLILDIFAQRASSREGKLQVELAQLNYQSTRLVGEGVALSRLAGGIGTRGPGETRLESDRRHIRTRISRLQQELKEVRRVRGVQRQLREKNSVPVVALIGYTNAGKSTLLNALTGAGIPANNRLFDTLDTTTRRMTVSDTLDVLLSDTVGFIAKLPHNLVEAFQATLEELQYADLLLHVIDASDPDRTAHMEVVEKLAAQLAPQGVPIIEVYNKADLVEPQLIPVGENKVAISAATGTGLPRLLELVEQNLDTGVRRVTMKLPYSAAGEVDRIHREGKVFTTEYENDGILVEAALSREMQGRYRDYILS